MSSVGRWTSMGRRLLVAWLVDHPQTSAKALAAECKVTAACISALVTGITTEPSLALSFELEKRAGISPKMWLLERRREMSKSTLIDLPHATTSLRPSRSAAQ